MMTSDASVAFASILHSDPSRTDRVRLTLIAVDGGYWWHASPNGEDSYQTDVSGDTIEEAMANAELAWGAAVWDFRITAEVITEFSVGKVSQCELEEVSDGYCGGHYDVELMVGERTLSIEGWVMCGWLAPGAGSDLNGSGLANWGSSQPGGWSVCDDDGQMSGRPTANDQGDYADPIEVGQSCGDNVTIKPALVPEWSAACLAVELIDAEADEDRYGAAVEIAEAIRLAVVEKINSVLADFSTDCPEPDAETIFDYLDPIDELEALPLRFGDFLGAGPVLAWKSGDDCEFEPHPSTVGRDLGKKLSEIVAETIEQLMAPSNDE